MGEHQKVNPTATKKHDKGIESNEDKIKLEEAQQAKEARKAKEKEMAHYTTQGKR